MTGPGGYPCCETMAALGPEDYVGGHHLACPATQELQRLLREKTAEIEEWRDAEAAAVEEASRLQAFKAKAMDLDIIGGGCQWCDTMVYDSRDPWDHKPECHFFEPRPADTPPDLASTGTYEITGRGTIKILPADSKVRVGDPVRIDGKDWICAGIESHSKPGEIGVLVRPTGSLASIPRDECDGADR